MKRLHFHLARRCVFIYIEPRDIWVGAYVAPRWVYVCLLPLLVIKVKREAW